MARTQAEAEHRATVMYYALWCSVVYSLLITAFLSIGVLWLIHEQEQSCESRQQGRTAVRTVLGWTMPEGRQAEFDLIYPPDVPGC